MNKHDAKNISNQNLFGIVLVSAIFIIAIFLITGNFLLSLLIVMAITVIAFIYFQKEGEWKIIGNKVISGWPEQTIEITSIEEVGTINIKPYDNFGGTSLYRDLAENNSKKERLAFLIKSRGNVYYIRARDPEDFLQKLSQKYKERTGKNLEVNEADVR